MDAIDHRILAALQEDSALSTADLADRVGLSPTPCWRRVRQLETAGYIRKRVALLDRDLLGVGTTVFVSIRTKTHAADWLTKFAKVVQSMPEVIEFHRMSGDIDYLMKVVVPDIPAYDAFYKRLISAIDLSDVSSSFAMEEIKATTTLPLTYLKQA
ncbi:MULTISPECIES: Lrp/AsnC family transcriptional regulator [unclassified Hwanghaeella]|uniref:Lrp/AsnC family transcriptional regulator n=1 Tax=unclassified Hwanghaeella TaxID=2605944 RepID=UPI000C941A08|nr:ArsR family transcriptional regulator [Rhodospirillales bacterium]MAO93741.1 ArsR family transcriptional regulator [Rhodospirillales bacterium]